MSYTALYRKWRPLVFEDLVEQSHVVKTLKNSVKTGRIAHAYLFCGTRGTGKTTMAKIFSRAINCIKPSEGDPCNECEICRGILSGSIIDVVEIDAASNNSVDNVREIRDEVIYAPSQAKYKVYIIDEVHMLSSGAFNALLKTLEEPPEHVVFILATTEPHKLPATILSRCQRFDFRRISADGIMQRLERIAGSGGITVSKEALKLIARLSEGALRDAISILDQCMTMADGDVTCDKVLSIVGIVDDIFIADVVDAVAKKNIQGILGKVEELMASGKDMLQFVLGLVLYFRNLLICRLAELPEELIQAPLETIEKMKKQCMNFKWATQPRILLEVLLIKLCERNYSENSDLLDRLSALERRVNSPGFTNSPVIEVPAPEKAAKIETKPENKTRKAEVPAIQEKPSELPGKELDIWGKALEELKGSGRVAIYTNLLGTRAVEIGSNVVGIMFGPESGFKKMLVSKAENLEIIEKAMSKVLGREIKVKCLDEARTGDQKREDKDEMIEKARDIARRLDVPFNVIDD